MNKLIYKIARLFRIKFCDSCEKCVWWSKKTLRWADGVDYDEDGSPYLTGYTAPACDDCIAYAEEERWY